MPIPGLILTLSALAGRPAAILQSPEPPLKVAVVVIDLNNLHKTLPDTLLPGRIQRLAIALRTRLTAACG